MSPYERTSMISHEIKSTLAKLLATEDLVVESKNVETACFNVHTRVLTLPRWEKASNEVYDMLVGHEVGHALFTPDEDWTKQVKVPPQFVNIVEDARIEKMMKRRYPGISKTFYTGYKELMEDDFFDIKDVDVDEMSLADRANLYFKVGSFLPVKFSQDEKTIIGMIDTADTFAEVLEAAEALYKYCKQALEDKKEEQEEKEEEANVDGNEPQAGGDTGSDEDKTEEIKNNSGDSDEIEVEPDEPETKTADSLEEALKDLVQNFGSENAYLELPKINLKDIVITNDWINQEYERVWGDQNQDYFETVDAEFTKFKKQAQKEVNYLVKEFECRKTADAYSRSSTARTGVLSTSKLHTYKYNEDLFKKVTIIPDGKNHGLVFILDWSGSMCDVLVDTCKQMFNLLWFCKKVNIPFEVYAFTNEYPIFKDGVFRPHSYEKKDGLIAIPEWFSLMNMFTSKTNAKTLEFQMRSVFRMAHYFSRSFYAPYQIPVGMGLSGTPLNESLVALHQIIPQFKQQNKLQKVQCIILTDGEAHPLKRHKEVRRQPNTEPYLGYGQLGDWCYLRDRQTGMTYRFTGHWLNITDVLLRDLRDKFTDVNFIGIRVLAPRDANSFIRRYSGVDDFIKIQKVWKKERAFSIKTSPYHRYFGISSSAMSSESDFDVEESATKSQIKRAFVNSLKSKKMNKKILNEFMDLVV